MILTTCSCEDSTLPPSARRQNIPKRTKLAEPDEDYDPTPRIRKTTTAVRRGRVASSKSINQKKRLQNREAATRYRQKKKEEDEEFRNHYYNTMNALEEKRAEKETIRQEFEYLSKLLGGLD